MRGFPLYNPCRFSKNGGMETRRPLNIKAGPVLAAAQALLMAFACMGQGFAWAIESRTIERMIEATEPFPDQGSLVEKRRARLERGRVHYLRFCAHCHGKTGQGNGRISYYLSPRPRDLSMGLFKIRSTRTNNLPLDRDLHRTIRNGIPGTAMPAWGSVLSDESIGALVEYIKTFSHRFELETPDFVANPELEPPLDSFSVAHGKQLYRELRCGRCHGKAGEREGPLEAELNDSWGHPSRVYDLRRPDRYKAGASAHAIHKTLTTGMDGTPMNAYDYLSNDEIWHLVHYLKAGFQGTGQPAAPAGALTSHRVEGALATSPLDPVWETVPAQSTRLFSLKTKKHRVSGFKVQSIQNGTAIAFRLQWQDDTPDTAADGQRFYLDAAALQFAAAGESIRDTPFFGMGANGKPVNIWHWKADVSQTVIRTTPASTRTASEKPLATVNPFTGSALEEINAEGMGTLWVQSLEDQQIRGEGVWENGVWKVVMVRELKTQSRYDVEFEQDGSMLVAVALWNGALKEKNADKTVSLWQVLDLQ